MCYEVFYNSVENSGIDYATIEELKNGLVRDFERSDETVEKCIVEINTNGEYCDDDITVIKSNREPLLDIKSGDNELIEDMWELTVTIEEPNMFGNYGYCDPYVYVLKKNTRPTPDDVEELIYQILEIEQLYTGEVGINTQITYNGDYVDGDEGFLDLHIVCDTNTPSKYFVWEKCTGLPIIYSIDRKNSWYDITE